MTGPLHGLRVLEMQGLAPVPFGGMILADLGADVIRIDRASGSGGITAPAGPLDRGKRSFAVDLKDPAGITVVRDLARDADVFIEGYRPGVAERLGIGPDELCTDNPGLIYARLTGWGQTGPLAARAGHDLNYVGVAGVADLIGRSGEAPVPTGPLLGDLAGGAMTMVIGVLAALHERQRSGTGQVIDAAIVDGAALLTNFYFGLRAGGMHPSGRGENLIDGGTPQYDTYRTADGGYVAVGALEPQFSALLVEALELNGVDPGDSTPAARQRFRAELTAKFLDKTRGQWADIFADIDACVTPVLSPWEAHLHPHNAARGSHIHVDGLRQTAPAPRFSRTPAAYPKPLEPLLDAASVHRWAQHDRHNGRPWTAATAWAALALLCGERRLAQRAGAVAAAAPASRR